MHAHPFSAIAARVRVVAVPIPRSESSVGKIVAMLDANPGQWFTVEELAARLRIDVPTCRQSINDLRTRGLVASRDTGQRVRNAAVFLYRLARDLSAHVPAEILAQEVA